MLLEDAIQGHHLLIECFIEVSNPLLQLQLLILTLTLKLLGTLNDDAFEINGGNGAILAFKRNRVHKLFDLVLSQTSSKLFKADSKLSSTQSPSGSLGHLISPLSKEAFIGCVLLENHSVNLDVSLIDPVLISLYEDCIVEFLEVEPSARRLDLSTLNELDLLIVRIGSLRADTTDVFEDLGELFIGELETHHGTFVQEVQFHNKFVVRWIKLLIGLLY